MEPTAIEKQNDNERNQELYKLHVHSAEKIVWTAGRFKRQPNLYVEIRSEQSVQRTRVVKRNLGPVWDEDFVLSINTTSILHLFLKHETSVPLKSDPCIGDFDIDVANLLRICESNELAILELKANGDGAGPNIMGFIKIRLIIGDAIASGRVAVAKARRDIEYGGVTKASDATDSKPVLLSDATINAEKASRGLMKALESVISKLDTFVLMVDKASKLHPYASFAWQVISSLYKAIRGQMERDKKLVTLVTTMEDLYAFVDAVKSLPGKLFVLEEIIMKILKQTVECAIFIREYTGKGFAARVAKQTILDPQQAIEDLTHALLTLKQNFDSGATLQTTFVSSRTLVKVETLVETEHLKLLRPAQMDGFSRPECLPGTRQEILRSVTDWLTTPSEGQNILWLHGAAGSGKSTISTTIAEYFRELNRLGAFIFFNRNDPTNSSPASVIRTLSYKLSKFDRAIAGAICKSIEHDPSVTEASIRVQFSKLLLEPLSSVALSHRPGPIIIVLDALDECGDPASRRELLQLLSRELSRLPMVFRFVITSRRDLDIETALSGQSNVEMRELDTTDEANASDIVLYLRHELAAIYDRNKDTFGLKSDWPGDDTLQTLASSSGGLFIWASTAVKYIEDSHHPSHALEVLLSQDSSEAESALDTLYSTALTSSGKWNNKEVAQNFRTVLGVVAIARVPVTDVAIDELFGLTNYKSCHYILSRLRCLLHWEPGKSIHALHASFIDYLTDVDRCGSQPWFIDISLHNSALLSVCFRCMKFQLKFNICELETSYVLNKDVVDLPQRVLKYIPASLIYASQFWADHLHVLSYQNELYESLKEFFQVRFLYWLEVLSVIQEIKKVSDILLLSLNWCKLYDCDIAEIITDTISFISTFEYPISQSAPHIYLSALPFSPEQSFMSKNYLPQYPQLLSFEKGRSSNWPINVKVLEGHTHSVNCVRFSPDGELFASGSGDRTIQIWSIKTGKAIMEPLKGHRKGVTTIAFSSDGKYIASGSWDYTILVWDIATGRICAGPYKEHSEAVISVDFSPNSEEIASASHDFTISVRNIKTDQMVLAPFKAHSGEAIWCVVFSPDGNKLASCSADFTVCIWDKHTGEMIGKPFTGHTSIVEAITFSPDGRYIASGSYDCTVQVWDIQTHELICTPEGFKGHNNPVMCVAFTSDGNSIASGSWDQTVQLWDIRTGKVLEFFEGHTDHVLSVAFSLDEKYLISGSDDKAIRIWEIKGNTTSLESFKGHANVITSVALSPDGKYIASGSWDKTMWIWNAKTGDVIFESLTGHTSSVMSIAFSPDSRLIVSGSGDTTLLLRDMTCPRTILKSFEWHTGSVISVAFSPTGSTIISGAFDHTLILWGVEVGELLLNPFRGHTNGVTSVAFSQNGQYVASGSLDCTARIWNVETGLPVSEPFKGHEDPIMTVALSSDGSRLATGSVDFRVYIWDAMSGQNLFQLRGHKQCVLSVAFSPNGKIVASGSIDTTIRLWNAETAEILSRPFEGHTGRVSSLIFSSDGSKIISGSWDQTIQVWNVESGQLNQSESNLELHNQANFYDSFRPKNGWMIGRNSELLFWVPPHHRIGLWQPRTTAIIGRHITKLNFDKFVHGSLWIQCC